MRSPGGLGAAVTEARLGADPEFTPIRLLPPHPDGQTVHVLEHGATVGRSGEELKVRTREGAETSLPSAEVGQIVLHGFAQITTQALRLCAEREIGVHWVTMGGGVIGSLAPGAAAAQRHLRQFAALTDPVRVVDLARRLVIAKLEAQLRYLLRATRNPAGRGEAVETVVAALRTALRGAAHADNLASLLGHEGGACAFGLRDDRCGHSGGGIANARGKLSRAAHAFLSETIFQ